MDVWTENNYGGHPLFRPKREVLQSDSIRSSSRNGIGVVGLLENVLQEINKMKINEHSVILSHNSIGIMGSDKPRTEGLERSFPQQK